MRQKYGNITREIEYWFQSPNKQSHKIDNLLSYSIPQRFRRVLFKVWTITKRLRKISLTAAIIWVTLGGIPLILKSNHKIEATPTILDQPVQHSIECQPANLRAERGGQDEGRHEHDERLPDAAVLPTKDHQPDQSDLLERGLRFRSEPLGGERSQADELLPHGQ